MEAFEYQQLAMRTNDYNKPARERLLNAALGLAGETGEFCDLIKKHLFHLHELDEKKVISELGDIAWYLALACDTLDIPLSLVLSENIEKLKRRYPSGFSTVDSIARVDTQPQEPEPEPDAWLWGERVNYIGPVISPTEGD